MKRLIVLCLLILWPRILFAADGALNGACQTKGWWRYCEVRLCDARDVNDGAGAPDSCNEFDLWSFSDGKPDLLVVETTADNCDTTKTQMDVAVLSTTGGVANVVKDKLQLGHATNGSFTFDKVVHRYVRILGDTEGTLAASCTSLTVIGRAWWRLR